MNLVSIQSPGGHCRGRCDARCYNAKGITCVCICGGVNHGKGEKQAIKNIREMNDSFIDNWQKNHPKTKIQKIHIGNTIKQEELFDVSLFTANQKRET